MVKEVERRITIEDKEYLISLILDDESCIRYLYVSVKNRQKGKRKWQDIELTSRESRVLLGLTGKRWYTYYVNCMRSRLPMLDDILQELKEELAEKVTKRIFKFKL